MAPEAPQTPERSGHHMNLVAIDAKRLEYSRYVGKKLDVRVKSERLLSADEVETFRQTPNVLIATPEPSAA